MHFSCFKSALLRKQSTFKRLKSCTFSTKSAKGRAAAWRTTYTKKSPAKLGTLQPKAEVVYRSQAHTHEVRVRTKSARMLCDTQTCTKSAKPCEARHIKTHAVRRRAHTLGGYPRSQVKVPFLCTFTQKVPIQALLCEAQKALPTTRRCTTVRSTPHSQASWAGRMAGRCTKPSTQPSRSDPVLLRFLTVSSRSTRDRGRRPTVPDEREARGGGGRRPRSKSAKAAYSPAANWALCSAFRLFEPISSKF